MNLRTFIALCQRMKSLGWQLVDYQPYQKYAVYQKDGQTREIGRRPV